MNMTAIGTTDPQLLAGSLVARAQPATTRASTTDVAEDTPSSIVMLSGQAPQQVDEQDSTEDGQPSKLKSFAYGAIGLGVPKSDAEIQAESPAQQEKENYYAAGRTAISALAIGTLLSVLI